MARNALRCAPMGTALFLKRRVYQQVDGRYRPVARHEAFAEITQEIVVACFRPRRDEMVASLNKSLLHLEARKCADNFGDVCRGNRLKAKAAPVEADAHRAHSNLCLLVKRY